MDDLSVIDNILAFVEQKNVTVGFLNSKSFFFSKGGTLKLDLIGNYKF